MIYNDKKYDALKDIFEIIELYQAEHFILSCFRSIDCSLLYYRVRSTVDEECIYCTNVQQKCMFYEYD